jgi:hypothetical protein
MEPLLLNGSCRRKPMFEATSRSVREIRSFSTFEPDTLTAYQFGNVFRKNGLFEPEEKLMFAVLTDAIECFQKYLGVQRRRCRNLFKEAEAWITNKDSKEFYSFEHVCEVLGISPSYLRDGLNRWRIDHENVRVLQRRIREPLRYQYRVKNNRVSI